VGLLGRARRQRHALGCCFYYCKEWECIIENFTDSGRKRTSQFNKSMVSVEHSALITSRETRKVYKFGYCQWVGIRQKQRSLQNMNKFAVGLLWAVTTHCINWVISGRRRRIKCGVSPLAAFQITETKEDDMIVITSTRVTQMLDIVKMLHDGLDSAKEVLWSEGPWLGEELSLIKHGKTIMKYRCTRPLQHVVTINVEAKTSAC